MRVVLKKKKKLFIFLTERGGDRRRERLLGKIKQRYNRAHCIYLFIFFPLPACGVLYGSSYYTVTITLSARDDLGGCSARRRMLLLYYSVTT